MTDVILDLFEYPGHWSAELTAVVMKYGEKLENGDPYLVCREFEEAVNEIGYTFDWYLDGEPYHLRKIGTEVTED